MKNEVQTRQIGPKAAKRAIRKAIKTQRAIFLWGSPGLGKSDIVKQIGDELGREVIDVRLALWEPTDIKGIPYFDSNANRMVWAPPAELPTDPDSRAIIFLDELNSAPPAVQAAAYQLVLNRRVGTYKLPDEVCIVAAGNRESDRGVTYKMPAPLANRFIHVEMRVDFDDWMDWAASNKLHPEVVGYLNFAKQDLYDFDPRSASKAFATPRSWSFVSELLQDDDTDSDTLHNLIAGAVGDGLAIKFMAHRKIAGQLPDPSDIIEGKVTDLNCKEISAQYSLATSMCYELQIRHERKDKGWHDFANNFLRYCMDNFTSEIVVMAAKMALSNFNLPMDPSKMPSFADFRKKYQKYIIAAMES